MVGINDLMAAAQRAGVSGGSGMTPTMPQAPAAAPAPADPMAQLTQLLGGVAASPQGGAMTQAIAQLMGGAGGNGGAAGQVRTPPGFPTDGPPLRPGDNYYDDALDKPGVAPNDPADGPMPGQKNMGAYLNANRVPGKDQSYAGFNGGDDHQDEWDDSSGSSAFVNQEGKGDKAPSNQDTVRDQLNKQQGPSTEDELDMVHKNMGSGDPSADGNFPTRQELKDLNAGVISPKEFDAKWGKGAAAEMMDEADKNAPSVEDDEGDHEYR
jgi:hypothetical protein